jgi:hypothetical protein
MRLMLFFILLIFLVSCNDTTHYDRELALYGNVIAPDGSPVANAEVFVFPELAVINSGVVKKSEELLEVELASFDAVDKIDYVLLKWQTASEMNNKMFVIEKSINNSNDFIAIDSIEGEGASNIPVFYEYKDYDISQNEFYMYRLKIVNQAGEYAYSDIRSIQTFELVVQLSNPYPNPFSSHVNFNFSILDYENQYIEIVEQSTGNVITTIDNFEDFSHHSFAFSGYKDGKDIRPGVYLCNLHFGDSVKSVKFVKHLVLNNYLGDLSESVTKTDENGLFKITYNYFPDLEEHTLTTEAGEVIGSFMYGGSAEVVVRKHLYEDANVTKFIISKQKIEIDKTRILEITFDVEEIILP